MCVCVCVCVCVCISDGYIDQQWRGSGMPWYVGHVPGVYDEWPECQAQVSGFSGGSQKGFDSRAEAEARYLRFIAQ